MRFFTSDTHFGHTNIISYCNRPFKDVPHMNEEIIRRWNSVVSDEDTVYHLGDVALGPWEDWDKSLSRLNGRKVLVIGNHDRVFEGGYSEKHRARFQPVYEQWFEIICDFGRLTLANKTDITMSHFPYEADHTDKARYTEYRLPDVGQPLLHGHTHDSGMPVSYSSKGTVQIHVGQDAWDYTPVSEDQIIALLEGLN